MRGNAIFLSFCFGLFASALSPKVKPQYSTSLMVLGLILFFILTPLALMYLLIHILVIAPITYIPTVLASAIVHMFEYSSVGDELVLKTGEGTEKVKFSNIVTNDTIAAKGFLIGFPSLVVSLYGAISILFIS
jgi:hypothetical protein